MQVPTQAQKRQNWLKQEPVFADQQQVLEFRGEPKATRRNPFMQAPVGKSTRTSEPKQHSPLVFEGTSLGPA